VPGAVIKYEKVLEVWHHHGQNVHKLVEMLEHVLGSPVSFSVFAIVEFYCGSEQEGTKWQQ